MTDYLFASLGGLVVLSIVAVVLCLLSAADDVRRDQEGGSAR